MSRKGTRPRSATTLTTCAHCPAVRSQPVGVVAAGVQHHHRAGFGRIEGGQHRIEIHVALVRVVIRVGRHIEAGLREQAAVVFPGGVADQRLQHLAAAGDAAQKVGAHLQAAGATEALHGGHAAGAQHLAVGAEHQRLHGGVVGGDAVDRQVAAGAGRGRPFAPRPAPRSAAAAACRSRRSTTPTPRFTLRGLGSALNCSVRPRMGSRGASSTAEKSDMVYSLVGGALVWPICHSKKP